MRATPGAAVSFDAGPDFVLPSIGELDAPFLRDGHGVPRNRRMTLPADVQWRAEADRLELEGRVRLPGGFLRDLVAAPAGRQFLLQKLSDGQLGLAMGD